MLLLSWTYSVLKRWWSQINIRIDVSCLVREKKITKEIATHFLPDFRALVVYLWSIIAMNWCIYFGHYNDAIIIGIIEINFALIFQTQHMQLNAFKNTARFLTILFFTILKYIFFKYLNIRVNCTVQSLEVEWTFIFTIGPQSWPCDTKI